MNATGFPMTNHRIRITVEEGVREKSQAAELPKRKD
jgi:hypothetical protein